MFFEGWKFTVFMINCTYFLCASAFLLTSAVGVDYMLYAMLITVMNAHFIARN